MKKFTHCWHHSIWLFLMLVAFSGPSMAFPLLKPEHTILVPVIWPITGKVVSSAGDPLPGVTVLVKGTSNGTTTTPDGTFSLNVPEEPGILVFSFIGYANQEKSFSGPGTYNITLVEDAKALEEVVVVGYGTQRKADVTGATASVSAKDLNAGVINNPMQAIQGKVAGLNIVAGGGDPTANRPSIRMRGTSSLSANSEPLIVIDGVAGADLNSVAPEDIEKIDVLKDASAAAIYGSRGANGVIMVTTKRGQAGKTTVEVSSYVGVEQVSNSLDFLSPDDYVAKLRELNLNVNANDYGARTDWFDEITRTAVSHNQSLAVSGGSEKFTYRGSIVYLNQPGIAINSGYDRLNGRLNLVQKALNDKLEIQLLLSQQVSQKDYVDYWSFLLAGRINPTFPVYNRNGTYLQPGIGGVDEHILNGVTTRIPGGFEIENPVARMRQLTNEARDKQTLGNLKIFLEPISGLRLGVNTSINNYNGLYGFFRPAEWRANGNTASFGFRSQREVTDRLIELTAQYARETGLHKYTLLGGYTYQKLQNEGFSAGNRDYPSLFGYNNLNAGNPNVDGTTNRDLGSYKSEAILVGFIGRLNYTYNDKYLLTANLRRDGSSRFGRNNRWGWFPSVSVGWQLKQENFLQNVPFLEDLKLRVGYGVTGNQEGIADYASRLLFGAIDPRTGTTSSYYSGGGFRTAYQFSQNANPDLKWETSEMTNVGLDFAFLNNRLNGSLEVYNKNTRDLLFNYTIAIGTKYGSEQLTSVTGNILANVGEINNKGIELSLDYIAMDRGDFQWRTIVNLAHNKNKVKSLSSGIFQYNAANPRLYGNYGSGQGGVAQPVALIEGRPVGQFYGPVFQGFNTQDVNSPRYIWGDFGGGGNDPSGRDRTFLGDANPSLVFGWGNTFSYKNFDLSFLLRGALGHEIVNGPYIYSANPNRFPSNNVISDAFTTGIPTGLSPAFSSLWVEDGDFVRLDNFRLSYRLPTFWKSLSTASVFIAGNNTFVITKYRGIDPEPKLGVGRDIYGGSQSAGIGQGRTGGANLTVAEASAINVAVGGQAFTGDDITGGSLSPGVEQVNYYPKTRSFSIGVSLAF